MAPCRLSPLKCRESFHLHRSVITTNSSPQPPSHDSLLRHSPFPLCSLHCFIPRSTTWFYQAPHRTRGWFRRDQVGRPLGWIFWILELPAPGHSFNSNLITLFYFKCKNLLFLSLILFLKLWMLFSSLFSNYSAINSVLLCNYEFSDYLCGYTCFTLVFRVLKFGLL